MSDRAKRGQLEPVPVRPTKSPAGKRKTKDTVIVKRAQLNLFRQAVAVTVKVENKADESHGAGVIISSHGLVLTAHHVIEGADKIYIRRCRLNPKSGRVILRGRYLAEVIYSHAKADIAVLRMVRPPKNLKAAPLGDSRRVQIGTPLYRVGRDEIPLASGYVIEKGRHQGFREIGISVQAAAGSSGGPVFDKDGNLVAIALREPEDETLPSCSYAITVGEIKRLLRRNKKLRHVLRQEE